MQQQPGSALRPPYPFKLTEERVKSLILLPLKIEKNNSPSKLEQVFKQHTQFLVNCFSYSSPEYYYKSYIEKHLKNTSDMSNFLTSLSLKSFWRDPYLSDQELTKEMAFQRQLIVPYVNDEHSTRRSKPSLKIEEGFLNFEKNAKLPGLHNDLPPQSYIVVRDSENESRKSSLHKYKECKRLLRTPGVQSILA